MNASGHHATVIVTRWPGTPARLAVHRCLWSPVGGVREVFGVAESRPDAVEPFGEGAGGGSGGEDLRKGRDLLAAHR
jgi:hypothetical protein